MMCIWNSNAILLWFYCPNEFNLEKSCWVHVGYSGITCHYINALDIENESSKQRVTQLLWCDDGWRWCCTLDRYNAFMLGTNIRNVPYKRNLTKNEIVYSVLSIYTT